MKIPVSIRRAAGFTLAEMMIVISIIVVLASLTIGGYNYAMRGSKRRTTEATMTAITSSLERYFEKFGEYPEPAKPEEMLQTKPGKQYIVGGARCLYQALRGDGYDAIKGVSSSSGSGGAGASDGDFEAGEIDNVMFKDMPPTMWRKMNGVYYIADAFSNPFQYYKAPAPSSSGTGTGTGTGSGAVTTINSTYDLWSYAEDEVNISMKSSDTVKTPAMAEKWIRNW